MRPGTRIGPYEILSQLGAGGAGVVFRARSPSQGEVALKIIHKKDPESFARFDRERRMLAEFGEAEGFVPLLDAGTAANGIPYIVMPFFRGGTLRARLEQGPLPIEEVLAIGPHLARALGRAHQRGVVHRDVKPDNMLYPEKDFAKPPLVSDLGLAKHFATEGEGRSVSLSRTGVFRGTAGYMPSEQMMDGKTVGPPADVFALAAVLYECVAGRPPFLGDTPVELFAAVEFGTPDPLRSLRADVPRGFAKVIERALSKAPEKRFKDGDDFAKALDAAKDGKEPSSNRGVLLALGLVIAIGIAFIVTRSQPPPLPPAASPAPAPPPPPAPPRGPFKETWGRHDWKHGHDVVSTLLSPDGTRVASTGGPRVRVWDTATGREVWTAVVPASYGFPVAYSPSGDRILAGAEDGKARVLDAKTGAPGLTVEAHPQGAAHAVAWAWDGESFFTGGGDPNDENTLLVKRWNARTGVLLGSFQTLNGMTRTIVPSRDGTRLFCAGIGGNVVVHETASGKELLRMPDEGRLTGLAVTEDERVAVTSNNDSGHVTLWDLVKGTRVGNVGKKFRDEAFNVDMTPDGVTVLGVNRWVLSVWKLPEQKPFWTEEVPSTRAASLTRDGKRAATGHEDGVVRFWDVEGKRELSVREGIDGPVRTLACSKEGMTVATNTHAAFTVAGRSTRRQVVTPFVGALALSADGGALLVTVNEHPDRQVLNHRILYDTRTGKERWHEQDLRWETFAAALSADGKLAVLGQKRPMNGAVGVVDLASAELGTDTLTVEAVTAIALTDHAGSRWIAGGATGTVTFGLTRPKGMNELLQPAGRHEGRVTCVAGRPKVALSGDEKGHVKVWDLPSGTLRKELLPAHAKAITALALSADGKVAATASEDGSLALWNLESLTRLSTIDLGTEHATALVFEAEKTLRVGTSRGVVHCLQTQ